jgi:hypothetical protein
VNDEGRRRRRRSDDESGGGLPLFPLVLVVILAGLLLGGALAHFFGGSRNTPASAPTAVAALPTPLAAPTLLVTPTPLATPTPVATSRPSVIRKPSASPNAIRTSAPAAHPSTTLIPRTAHANAPTTPPQAPVLAGARKTTPRPIVAAGSPAPAPLASSTLSVAATGGDRASSLVRSYLEALARGDRATAASYLAHGLPSETFMSSDAHVESIRSANVGSEQYRVTADVQTATGEYYVTFTVEEGPAGLQITDHYAIKPQ